MAGREHCFGVPPWLTIVLTVSTILALVEFDNRRGKVQKTTLLTPHEFVPLIDALKETKLDHTNNTEAQLSNVHILSSKAIQCNLGSAPTSIVQACPVMYPRARETVRKFWGAEGQRRPLRLRFLNTEPSYRMLERRRQNEKNNKKHTHVAQHQFEQYGIWQSQCGQHFNASLTNQDASGYVQKFSAELLVPSYLKRSPYVLVGEGESDFTVVEFCDIGRSNGGWSVRDLPKIMEMESDFTRSWQLNRSSFVIVLTGDHGPCIQSNEKAGAFRTRKWIEEGIRNATFVLNEGSRQGGCYSPTKDIIVPTPVIPKLYPSIEMCEMLITERKHLMFFTGKGDSLVRRDLMKTYAHDPDFFGPEKLSLSEYMCEMAQSTFCIAPRGNAAWSPRLGEAIYAGCIPVLMADNYDPPFSRFLNYTDFTITVPEDNFRQLKTVLRSVTTTELERLHRNIKLVRYVLNTDCRVSSLFLDISAKEHAIILRFG